MPASLSELGVRRATWVDHGKATGERSAAFRPVRGIGLPLRDQFGARLRVCRPADARPAYRRLVYRLPAPSCKGRNSYPPR